MTATSTRFARRRSSRSSWLPERSVPERKGRVAVKQKTARGGRPRRHAKAPASEAAPRVVVLAAGVGSRMRSSIPKVLHRIGGRPMLHAVLDAAERLSPAVTVVVLGAARPRVEEALSDRRVTVALQDPPLG